ncbi:MAG: nucleotidyl transferase AbiEii/AbiGii toxin family protein [Polynucleobacter sp.]|nr:MAG: nucleotidyl transferase AbiEii/AbiGii toxin family protein [Polynucleobacter sp.]
MKKINELEKLQVIDVINEQDLGISEFALEKDYMVTDALVAISKIKNPDFELVFCGGTCLSKAYGLLQRVSEDVDIKANPKAKSRLSKSLLRSKMSLLKKDIEIALNEAGFKSEFIAKDGRDGNQFLEFVIQYSTYFEVSPGMRAQLKLEISYSPLRLPKQDKTLTLLFDTLTKKNSIPSISMACVDLREALAEKLITFPRRLALSMSKSDEKPDSALVRHLYDVYQITEKNSDILNRDLSVLTSLAMQVIDQDSKDFASQHPAFVDDAFREINKAMQLALNNNDIKRTYEKFIEVMVYEKNAPSFEVAFSRFSDTLKKVLPQLNC